MDGHSSSSDSDTFVPEQPTPATVLQTVNIRAHVPVTLDVDEANYGHWRCFFDEVLGKFGLAQHVRSPPPLDERDAEWHMDDHCIVGWIYTTISKSVFDIVHTPKRSAFSLWSDVENLFRDNELQRAVYLEAEFRSLRQGDMTITQYCARLKHLADQLRDVGHAVSEPSQVLNLLRGLNPRFRHVKPVITAKFPPHTFMSARSFLLLEELGEEHDAKNDAAQALAAGHSSDSKQSSSGESSSANSNASASPPGTGSASFGAPRVRSRNRCRGRGSGAANNGGYAPRAPAGQPWTAGYNPWTGMVQAWPMPFRAPGAGVLGPRPPVQPQQAMAATQMYAPSTPELPQALYSALHSAGVATAPSASDWYLDTGATSHMSSTSGMPSMSSFEPHSATVTVGNGALLPVHNRASATLPTSQYPLRLNHILLCPSLVKNLLSIRRLTRDNNVSIEFDSDGFSIKAQPTKVEILRCNSTSDLYPLRPPQHLSLTSSSAPSVSLWHARLGHPGTPALSQLLHNFPFHCNKATDHNCHACRLGKHARLPFSASATTTHFPFQLVHSDVWTSPVLSHTGFKYYVVLLDDFSHYVWTFPLRQKSDVPYVLRTFFAYVHTQFRLPILAVQTDNGKEFDSYAMRTFFAAHGTQLRLSCPYTSQQNGKAERILHTINNCLRTLLLHCAAPLAFWAEALSTATFLLNRRPCRATASTTPHQLLFGTPPSYDDLRVFGCRCYPNTTATAAHKLSARSAVCAFIGYPADHRGYRCYDLASGRVITSRHVLFDEHSFPFKEAIVCPSSAPSQQLSSTDFPPGALLPCYPRALPPQPPRARTAHPVPAQQPATQLPIPDETSDSPGFSHPAAPLHPPLRPHSMVTRSRTGAVPSRPARFTDYAMPISSNTSAPQVSPVPTSVRKALRDSNWLAAMKLEFDALQHNQTWTLVPRPPGARIITGKWVFQHKFHSDGTLERYKRDGLCAASINAPTSTLARRSPPLSSLRRSAPF